MNAKPRVIIIGAGFGGLYAARELAGKPVDVLLIDRQNFHTFTPLLYQVATAGLDPSDIAYPVRGIFRREANIHFRLGTVTDIDEEARAVTVMYDSETFVEGYDYLIIAAGSVTNFYNNQSLERNAHGLKSVAEAITLRNHVLQLFERAAWEEDPEAQRALTTMVVVGGGPTGLETAGAMYELYNFVLRNEYSGLKHMNARVILLEALDNLLLAYPQNLRDSAKRQLESLGVEVMLNAKVQDFDGRRVLLADGREIPAHTLVWSAGVKGSALANALGIPLEKGGRIPVTPALEVIDRPGIFAVGDIAHLVEPKSGQPYPQVIPVANQQGPLAAQNILRAINGDVLKPFIYNDRGIMATIGRRRAVAWPYYAIQLTGYLGWITWLFLHLVWLIGFRNRISVLINWVWNYFTYDRSVRIIVNETRHDSPVERREAPAEVQV